MQSLFDKTTAGEIEERLQKIHPESQRLWGKMTVSQMLAHVNAILEIATGDKVEKAGLMQKLMGPLIKKVVLNEKPFKHGLPTGSSFIIKDERDFFHEKENLLATYRRFIKEGTSAAEGRVHPIFGKLTAHEWGQSQWKHFDHHLRQFRA